jgi:putative acetyltransferase
MRAGLTVADDRLESAAARGLIEALNRELSALYPPEQRFHELEDPAAFVVARVGEEAVGCGALRVLDAARGELKRMYVAPGHRGPGVGRAIVAALEERATALGLERVVLETGVHQLAAISLYESAGYARCTCWGAYRSSPGSVCYGKRLATASATRSPARPSP